MRKHKMSQQEQILTFQSITGSSEATCKKFLSSNNWNVEAAISAYFDSGSLDISEELIANIPDIPYIPPEIENDEEIPVISLVDKDKASRRKTILKKVIVLAQIVDFIAKVDVQLSFFNDNDFPIEGEFRFYQPESTLCGFQSEIKGVVKVAQIKEKEEARDVYDDAIASGKNAVLVESDDNEIGLFKTNIGNLPPKTECKIRFNYLHQLSVKDKQLQFGLPISRIPFRAENRESDYLEITCELTMSHSILELESNYESTSKINEDDAATGSLVFKSYDTMFQEFLLLVRLDNMYESTSISEEFTVVGDEITNANILQASKGKIEKNKQKLCTLVNFCPDISEDEVENDSSNSEIIFLLDRSGSMAGSRMTQAKNALQLFLRSLNENIYFNIVSFGDSYKKLFPTSKLYSQSTLNTAKAEVDKFDADLGGTNILDPLTDVLRSPFLLNDRCPRQLFIVTDGEVSNTRKVLATIRKYSLNTRIFTFGIGASASKALVTGMAREGRGYSEFVVSGERVEPKVLSQLKKALQPVITDVSIEFTGVNQQLLEQLKSQQYPQTIPPIYNGDQLYLYFYSDDLQLPGDESQLHLFGKIGKISKKWSVSIDWNRRLKDNIIHLIAASTGIRDYETELYNNPDDEDISEKCIQLSTTYGILSSLTSFISVHGNVEATEKSMERIEFPELHLPFNNNQPPIQYADFHAGGYAKYSAVELDSEDDDESEGDMGFGVFDDGIELHCAKVEPVVSMSQAKSLSQPQPQSLSSHSYYGGSSLPSSVHSGSFASFSQQGGPPPPSPMLFSPPPPAGRAAPPSFATSAAYCPPAAPPSFASSPSRPMQYFAAMEQCAAPAPAPAPMESGGPVRCKKPAARSSAVSKSKKSFFSAKATNQRDSTASNSNLSDERMKKDKKDKSKAKAEEKKFESNVEKESSQRRRQEVSLERNEKSSFLGGLLSNLVSFGDSFKAAGPSLHQVEDSLADDNMEISNALSAPLDDLCRYDSAELEAELCRLEAEEDKREKDEDDGDDEEESNKVFQRPLDHLVYLQNFDGKWKATQALAELLKLTLNQIKLSTPNGVNLDIWCTVLCVTALRLRFADSVDEWQLLANKASKWLKNQNSNIQEQLSSLFEQANALLTN